MVGKLVYVFIVYLIGASAEGKECTYVPMILTDAQKENWCPVDYYDEFTVAYFYHYDYDPDSMDECKADPNDMIHGQVCESDAFEWTEEERWSGARPMGTSGTLDNCRNFDIYQVDCVEASYFAFGVLSAAEVCDDGISADCQSMSFFLPDLDCDSDMNNFDNNIPVGNEFVRDLCPCACAVECTYVPMNLTDAQKEDWCPNYDYDDEFTVADFYDYDYDPDYMDECKADPNDMIHGQVCESDAFEWTEENGWFGARPMGTSGTLDNCQNFDIYQVDCAGRASEPEYSEEKNIFEFGIEAIINLFGGNTSSAFSFTFFMILFSVLLLF